jgi:hypothetical protein
LSPDFIASAGLSPDFIASAGLSPDFIASAGLGVAAAGVAVAAGVTAAGGVGVSVAQEARPADKPRLATIKRALKFIVVIFYIW